MKIINNKWKTFFVNEANFLLKTDKAFFIQLPTAKGELVGLWLGLKMAKYNELSKKGNPVYSFSINKDLEYKLFGFSWDEKKEPVIHKEFQSVIKGADLIDKIYNVLKK